MTPLSVITRLAKQAEVNSLWGKRKKARLLRYARNDGAGGSLRGIRKDAVAISKIFTFSLTRGGLQ
ncbi:hypothetical protein JCM13991_09550 [Thermodesulfovibrio hydrogeniphilus]